MVLFCLTISTAPTNSWLQGSKAAGFNGNHLNAADGAGRRTGKLCALQSRVNIGAGNGLGRALSQVGGQ